MYCCVDVHAFVLYSAHVRHGIHVRVPYMAHTTPTRTIATAATTMDASPSTSTNCYSISLRLPGSVRSSTHAAATRSALMIADRVGQDSGAHHNYFRQSARHFGCSLRFRSFFVINNNIHPPPQLQQSMETTFKVTEVTTINAHSHRFPPLRLRILGLLSLMLTLTLTCRSLIPSAPCSDVHSVYVVFFSPFFTCELKKQHLTSPSQVWHICTDHLAIVARAA